MNLPRLLYVGDVPVEASVAGSLLLHRLLGGYPPERLLVWESNLVSSRPERRLVGVEYQAFTIGSRRWFNSRVQLAYAAWLVLTAGWRSATLCRAARKFKAEAILSVAHGFGWLSAAAAARRLGLPLHLIVHDDWLSTVPVPTAMRPAVRQIFARVYRTAASRLCVSPGMAEEYARDFGSVGEVLYPSRGPDSPTPHVRRGAEAPQPFVIAYAGSLWNAGFVALLERLAQRLEPMHGLIDLYTDAAPDGAALEALAGRPNVRWRGFLPPAELARQWAQTAAALFVPGSFLPGEARAMRLLFSSKIVDYTAGGLPLLIWAPEDSSAARWARENPGCALLITDPAGEGLEEALLFLRDNGSGAVELATRAVEAGERDFSHQRAFSILARVLVNGGLASRASNLTSRRMDPAGDEASL